ncbi:MAG TPA: hypothetical protein ENG16_00590 [Archaeoglobus sp.]|nr:hypothetical protein [Archaeoglobus sp.]
MNGSMVKVGDWVKVKWKRKTGKVIKIESGIVVVKFYAVKDGDVATEFGIYEKKDLKVVGAKKVAIKVA